MKAFIFIALLFLTVSAAPPQQPIQKMVTTKCIKSLILENSVLTDSIRKYLEFVGDYEIPIVAVQTSGDTTHYLISAFIWTYSIKKNPPTAIVKLADREALLYTGKGSIAQTAPDCYQYLMKKYSYLLHVDKMNRRDKLPIHKNPGFLYDPIRKDIAIAKDGRITVKSIERFPYITYDE